jgi:hypothetical protein
LSARVELCHPESDFVILSEAKNLSSIRIHAKKQGEILHFVQNDNVLSFFALQRVQPASTSKNTHPIHTMNPYWLVVGGPAFLQLFFFVRWLHRRTRDDEIRRAFVRDMAINHLPHLYHAIRQIAGQLGIELQDPPPVQFLELNGHDRKRR